jgi:spermidine/putrescine transport system substrate-binding protein
VAERYPRRAFLGRAGSLALASALTGCGIEGTLDAAKKAATPAPSVTHPKVPIGDWTFSNWTLYIDKKVLKAFDKRFGGHVKYVEDINDNDEFYGKVRQQLQAGSPIGRDIVTLTDFMVAKWVRNRYVQPFDKKNIPNFYDNLVDNLKGIPYDPKRLMTAPWQSGATGIGYNPKKTGRELKSINDRTTPPAPCASPWASIPRTRSSTRSWRRSRRSRRPTTPASSAASPATTTRPT